MCNLLEMMKKLEQMIVNCNPESRDSSSLLIPKSLGLACPNFGDWKTGVELPNRPKEVIVNYHNSWL